MALHSIPLAGFCVQSEFPIIEQNETDTSDEEHVK